MGKVLDLYCAFLKLVTAICLMVMVIPVFGNVFLRYGFNSGITVSEVLSRSLLVRQTFFAAIEAPREHAHLGVDSFVKLLSATGKKVCFIISYAAMIYADWLLLAGSWKQTLIGWADRAPATNLSYGLFYGAGVIFGVSAGVILIYDLLRALSGQASEADLVAVKESEEQ